MRARYIPVVAFTTLIVAIQLATHFTDTGYHLTQLTMTAYYSLLVVGLCMLTGYAGQISIGHAGFFAIGGYFSAYLTTHNLLSQQETAFVSMMKKAGLLAVRPDLYGGEILNVHPWAACLAAILAAVVIAYLVGGPVLKLKGHYLAMATLGFGVIIYRIALGTEFLGAADGISDVPGFPIVSGVDIAGKASLRVVNYYAAWGLVIAGMVVLLNLIHSRVGRALASIHGAEDAAEAMGIPAARYKLHTFVLSAVFASVAGVFLTHYNGGIGPSEASVMKSVRYVAIVAIGGMANLWGALSMSLVLNYLSLRGYFGTYDDAVFGGILILIMLFAPDGLLRRHLLADLKRMVSGGAEGEAP
ncbi:MAG: branched-chain amino acid ABC transporter permease [Deltaproteobacteria bacterium]|nr:branched-chain amino acid ABC transporter permease [Deltaproteobacteria bacterium]